MHSLSTASELRSPAQACGGVPRQAELVVNGFQQMVHHPIACKHIRRDRSVQAATPSAVADPEPLLEPPRAEALEDLRGQRQHLRAGEPD
eukprot:CAMPEP_0179360558 /NCGR_PEP_ID=MMETSP0797-20121207/80043_1 /TAXON_ID=47934 /ORGANISM="Dinophysis acuminata, Strain DAEP01" /LENGTH=89 /DNA_ID=CAMNT_0021075925 /DNA_START=517 /DNA_END=784 /DNA_ORIENTATION=+